MEAKTSILLSCKGVFVDHVGIKIKPSPDGKGCFLRYQQTSYTPTGEFKMFGDGFTYYGHASECGRRIFVSHNFAVLREVKVSRGGRRAGSGRPKSDTSRGIRVQVRLNEEEHRLLGVYAGQYGVSLPAYTRFKLFGGPLDRGDK